MTIGSVDLGTSGAGVARTDPGHGRPGHSVLDRTLIVRVLPAVLVVSGALLLIPIGDIRTAVSTPLAVGQLGPLAAVLDLGAGLLLLLAGVGAWLSGLGWRIGLLAVLAGLAWFGPGLFAIRDTDPVLRLLGHVVLPPLLWPLLLHLGAAHLDLDTRRDVRLWLVVLYGAAVMMSLVSMMSYEAFWDPWCLDCNWDNPLVAGSGAAAAGHGIPAMLRLGSMGLAMAAGGTAAWFAARGRTVSGVRPGRRLATIAAMALIGIAAILEGALLLIAPVRDPRAGPWLLDWSILAASVLTMAGAVTATAIWTWQRRERMWRLVDSLVAAPEPGALVHSLAMALEDPELAIDYVTADDRVIDADGEVTSVAERPERVTTPIERDGVVLAHVHHSATTARAALAAAFGPTLLAALDNERLRAAQLAQLLELRRSRARIVAVADATRRRLERDLHDGVQQQLIAMAFDLRSLQLRFSRAGDAQRTAAVVVLETRVQAAIDELRRIAHGIHPAILSRSGLKAALDSLADEWPEPMVVQADGLGRLPDTVETAAYAVATEMVGDATARGASAVTIAAYRSGPSLNVEIRDDGRIVATPPQRLSDRLEASGGTITVEVTADGVMVLRGELPCA